MTRPSKLSARRMDEPIVIFDTVVFVRALLNPHSLWGRLVFDHYHEYRLIVTPPDRRQKARRGKASLSLGISQPPMTMIGMMNNDRLSVYPKGVGLRLLICSVPGN